MSAIDVLRDEYPGDLAWKQFVDVFRSGWTELQNKSFYNSAFGDEDIAIVLATSMGQHSTDWFNKPCGALGKRSPADVITNEPFGARIIRTLLMRMPR
jgi:hypothetical protein